MQKVNSRGLSGLHQKDPPVGLYKNDPHDVKILQPIPLRF